MKFNQPTLQSILAAGLLLGALSTGLIRAQNLSFNPTTTSTRAAITPDVASRISRSLTSTPATAAALGNKLNAPRDMKLLIVALDGTEPDYAAIKFFVETLGIPYQTAFTLKPAASSDLAPARQPLPALTDGGVTKGLYQGIILTNGNLGYCYTPAGDSPSCQSSLMDSDWAALENYSRDFGVRLVSYYTFPEARYGLSYTGRAIATTDGAPANAVFTPEGQRLFPYVNTSNPLKIANSYLYYATAAPGPGETTTPILMVDDFVAAAIHTKPDGREYMALTMDNNPNLLHSLVLNYGILNWVTRGVFLGGRKVYLTPQVDDHFLANDLFVQGTSACTPTAFVADPTYDPSTGCPTLRILGDDLKTLSAWQKQWNDRAQFKRFKVTHAYNGVGSRNDVGSMMNADSLVNQTMSLRSNFYWVSHTWDHRDLDCYTATPNGGVSSCVPASYDESTTEIDQNSAQGRLLTIPLDRTGMVTPEGTGLNNPGFLKAAVDLGIRYLVADTSHPEYLPAIPNTGIRSALQRSIVLIPRRPTGLFYNTTTGVSGVPGSVTDEYNYFYGPNGLMRVGGAGGTVFFKSQQTYADIIERESNTLLTYMLRAEIYPQMYHQSNLNRYNGSNSMFSDVHDAALSKFAAVSNLPVISLTETAIGREIESKMTAITSQVSAVLTPGQGIMLQGLAATRVTVTGACLGTQCEAYGGQCVSKISVQPAASSTIPLSALTSNCTEPAPTDADAAEYRSSQLAVDDVQRWMGAFDVTISDWNRLQLASGAITDALDPSLWFDGNRLLFPDGKTFFDSHLRAVVQLMAMQQDPSSKVPAAELATTLRRMLAIDQALASTAVRIAGSGDAELQAGDSAAMAGRYDDAVLRYSNAWTIAESAIDNAVAKY